MATTGKTDTTGNTGSTAGAPSIAKLERQRLCDLLLERGPLAPTLCEGWTASDLAAHLYVRESQPWNAVGIIVPSLSSLPEKAMEKAKGSIGFEGLVERVRSGPSAWFRLLDSQVNAVEYFIHDEDLRRAGHDALPPRQDEQLDAFAWTSVKRTAKLFSRKLRGTGLELTAPGRGTLKPRAGTPVVTVTGGPQELLLFLYGRKDAAMVDFSGPDDAVTTVREASFGL